MFLLLDQRGAKQDDHVDEGLVVMAVVELRLGEVHLDSLVVHQEAHITHV